MKTPEQYRWQNAANGMGSTYRDGNNGVFVVPQQDAPTLRCIASDGGGWDHVSVSLLTRCPIWEEMCLIKSLFWDDEMCVIQYHPSVSEYINNHPYCLHLWRPQKKRIIMPPSIMVGVK